MRNTRGAVVADIDYKRILTEYMKGVVRARGSTFIDHAALTRDERRALLDVECDAKADRALLGYWNFGAER